MTEQLTEPATRAPYKWNHLNVAYTPLQNELVAKMRDWTPDSACRTSDMFMMDVDVLRGDERDELEEALRHVCVACPVRVNCLNHALKFPERHGFWAGYNAEQLKSMRKNKVHTHD